MKNSWYVGCRVVAKQASLALSPCISIVSSMCKHDFIVVLINIKKSRTLWFINYPNMFIFFLVDYKKQHLYTRKDEDAERKAEWRRSEAQEVNRYPSWPCWHGDSKASHCSSTGGPLATALESHRYGSAVKTHTEQLHSGFNVEHKATISAETDFLCAN